MAEDVEEEKIGKDNQMPLEALPLAEEEGKDESSYSLR